MGNASNLISRTLAAGLMGKIFKMNLTNGC